MYVCMYVCMYIYIYGQDGCAARARIIEQWLHPTPVDD